MMLKGIAHIAFVVEDMDKSLHFFSDILGFKVIHRQPDDKGNPWLIHLKAGDRQFLELYYGGTRHWESKPHVNMSGFSHMCLDVDDIHEIADRLVKNGCKLDVEPMQGKDHNWQCWSKDPDGNRIEFMQISPLSPQSNA